MGEPVQSSRHLVLAGGLLLGSTMVGAPALAAPITYHFTGTITPPLTMTGAIQLATADQNENPKVGRYTIENFQVTFGGGYTTLFGPGSSGTVRVVNNVGGVGTDQFNVRVNAPHSNNVNFLAPPHLHTMGLGGPSSIFDNDASLNFLPSIGSFTGSIQFRPQFGLGNEGTGAAVEQLTPLTAVPLPASVIVFSVALVALIGLGAGGLRK